jgi:hypothetical protein
MLIRSITIKENFDATIILVRPVRVHGLACLVS